MPEYQLLVRAFSKQVVREDDALRLKTKEDGSMNSSMLQNPSDPEATYREKAGKQHRGYVANVTESVGEDKSIITDYQFDANTHSDSDFLKEHMESVERTPGRNTLVTDGAYSSEANRQLADDKNIDLVTTVQTFSFQKTEPGFGCVLPGISLRVLPL